MNPADLDIEAAGEKLRAGKLSARDLLTTHLERIARVDPDIGAFVARDDALAIAQAERVDADFAAGRDRGLLQGIPVALKDLIDTADFPTQYGSALFAGHRPENDAACVATLRQAGAVIIGKLATYEFATVGPSFDTPFSPPCNPWSPDHITGGSSSGSAAAVAAGLVRIAIGTDTGGSVRSPAAYCGVAGLKPGRGIIPEKGVFALSPSLDHIGVLAASVREAHIAHCVLAGAPAWHASSDDERLDGLVIGYARDWFFSDPRADRAVCEALDAAASTLSMLGAQIREVSLPPYEHFEAAGAAILHAEAFAIHRERLVKDQSRMGVKTTRTLLAGAAIDAEGVAVARHAANRLRDLLETEMFGHCDAVLTATTLTPALPRDHFRGNEAVWTPMRTIGFNLTGHPALAVPAGFASGLPLSMQLAGPMGGENLICRIGTAFERATDFSAQRPPLRQRAGTCPEREN